MPIDREGWTVDQLMALRSAHLDQLCLSCGHRRVVHTLHSCTVCYNDAICTGFVSPRQGEDNQGYLPLLSERYRP